jgi:antitoxin ParD1/3/4
METQMIVKATVCFTDRHHHFLSEKVGQGIFSTQSAAAAAALEQMMQDEEEREVALSALWQETRARMETPRTEFTDQDDAFVTARATIGAANGARSISSGSTRSSR